jgi:hypothetical protein
MRQLRLPLPQLLFTNIRDTQPQFPCFTVDTVRHEAMSLGTKGFTFRLASFCTTTTSGCNFGMGMRVRYSPNRPNHPLELLFPSKVRLRLSSGARGATPVLFGGM